MMADKSDISTEVAVKLAQVFLGPAVNEYTAPDIISGVADVVRPLITRAELAELESKKLRKGCSLFEQQIKDFGNLISKGYFHQDDCMIHVTVEKLKEAMSLSFPTPEKTSSKN